MEASLRREAVSDGPNGDSCAAICRAGAAVVLTTTPSNPANISEQRNIQAWQARVSIDMTLSSV